MATKTAARTARTPEAEATAPVPFARMLVALDQSDHANRALAEAIRLAGTAEGAVTGIHAYAARLHDFRFRQMEGGLPERYLEEEEMDYQREAHDDLITRGLEIISDSYHDFAEKECEAAGRPYRRLSPEGKNYRRVVEAVASGEFDVLALGAVGIGAAPGSLIGTVCERVVRRCPIDVLVIRDPERAIGDGPIVVAIDGSSRSYGALKTALDIGRRLGAEVRAVAAYDPYFHYVAFNHIAGVLSDEAGKVFRFKEQEQLHEELIDDGIAKIYQSHLEVARRMAGDEGVELSCELLDGKPYKAIRDYAENVNASLLLLGKVGIHADSTLDIGGNAENLLRSAPCHIWLGQATYTPPFDVIALARLARVPESMRPPTRARIETAAREQGAPEVTLEIVEAGLVEARRAMEEAMKGGALAPAATELEWTPEAEARLERVPEGFMRGMTRTRIEAFARRNKLVIITLALVEEKYADWGGGSAKQSPTLEWSASARERIERIPDFIRGMVMLEIERCAREMGLDAVTGEALDRARDSWESAGAFHSENDPDLYK